MTEKELIDKYNSIVSIWIRWDESYWTSFHMFLILTGFLFAGFTQVLKPEGIALIFCFAGVIVSIFWLFTLNRKFVHLQCAEKEGRKLEKIIYRNIGYGCFRGTQAYAKNDDEKHVEEINDILGIKKIFAWHGTGTIIACYFPISIMFIWILLGIYYFMELCMV